MNGKKLPLGQFMPGEMFHQYAERIRKECPNAKCIFATLANGAHGYIPIPELMDTDIYEAKLCEGSFLDKYAGDKITDLAIKMINTDFYIKPTETSN